MFRSADAMRSVLLAAGLLATAAGAQAPASDAPRYGFGRVPTPQEIAGWDIDVRPDGHGVRKGKGTVAQGQDIYDAQCASCHGTFGESNRYMAVAGGVKKEDLASGRTTALSRPDGLRTLGTKLNAATTLWDYIYRAMPWTSPQSLTVDQTYAVTAYVLHLNEIVPSDFELNDGNLTKVQMPNRNGMTTNHGMWAVKGKPDVQGSNCMKDCAKEVKVVSSLPEFARNQHGNLAEQKRPFGPYRGIDTTRYDSGKAAVAATSAVAPTAAATAGPNVQQLLANNACTACHATESKVIGPGFREIWAKYKSRADAETYLVKKIKEGGQGAWGAVPMPAQPALKENDAKTIAGWILGGAK
jgi:cytochrome c551/c552